MIIKKSIGEKIFDAGNIILMILLMVITLYPFLYVVFASLSNPFELMAHTGILLKPLGFSTAAYKAVIKNEMIVIGYRNTLFYVAVGTAYNILMTSLGAYVLSRRKFYWKKYIMAMVVFTMFFNGGLVPNFLLIKRLGMYNTFWAVIIPGAISTWNLFIMRTSFMSIPASLEESAKIDGANDIIVLIRIVLPLSLPVIAVMVLYYGVGHWNAWFNAMIYLKNRNLYPLQLVLREILILNDTKEMISSTVTNEREPVGEVVKYATIIVATLPILCVYPFLQKYFVKGVMIGALKG